MNLTREQIESIDTRISAQARDLHDLIAWLEKRPDFTERDPVYLAVKATAERMGHLLILLHYAKCGGGGAPTVSQEPPEIPS